MARYLASQGPIDSLIILVDILKQTKFLRGKAEGNQVVIGCSGDIRHLPSACMAARMTGVPFAWMVFDDYVARENKWRRVLARMIWSLAKRRIGCYIATNEYLALEAPRSGANPPHIVRNPLPQWRVPLNDAKARSPAIIIYAGSIYEANLDSLIRLIAAIDTEEMDVELLIVTPQSTEALAMKGVRGSRVRVIGPMEESGIGALLSQASILFLPLAFDSPFPEVIRTASPGKMAEYLNSGIPILAHVPSSSYVAWFLNQHECGLVIDTLDVAHLKKGLLTLLEDENIRSSMIERQLQAALLFDLALNQKELIGCLDSIAKSKTTKR